MTDTAEITKIRIGDTDVYLEDYDNGRGKIVVSNSYGHNYSYYWGAMSGTLSEFICRINSGYFADKLLGATSSWVMDTKATFTAIRKHIREEMDLPWYTHMEFQREMRELLKSFQSACQENENEGMFVDWWWSKFVERLPYYQIDDRIDRETIKKDFYNISEPWGFIEQKPSPNYKYLLNLHKELKNELINQQTEHQ